MNTYDCAGGIATITMDDGKVNALSPEMLADVAAQFDRAEADGAIVIAMGALLLLSADHRVGARGDFRIGLNEVAIGLTLPWFAIEIARHRLTRPYFDRCTVTGALLGPEEATTAGFLDEVVEPDRLMPAAEAAARALAALDRGAHQATKLRVREAALAGVRDGIDRIKSGNREW
jgi:enoyl-CoA hydratase/carnithine racemase